ncbi:serine/threonine-protein phosphatase 7 long form homolog [Gastrolobium bilobum]|uniref:serine/threonine-protein phosphatase 7 long form homolog n=1 Tax=Gastrolobium bilobum TaxID=150636 RepID=UPI002AAF2BCC|nr:serine/threonine-protein phosphatase 7 long form homolog [Gastrolobium bilobum]
MADSSSSSGSASDVEPTDPSMYIIPGSYKWEVLRKRTQRAHISQRVWNTEHVRKIKTRRGKPTGGPPTGAIPEVVADYLTQAGFIHVSRMRHIQIDAPLISVVVERWRPETHTFNMTQGEMTITLQDVADILSLPTDGAIVTGSTSEDWPAACGVVFGAVPQSNEFHHSGDLRISYLDWLYTRWTDHAGDHDAEIYFTKAHFARMLSSWLLADKSGGSNFGCRLVPLLGGGFDEIGFS